MPNHGNDYSDGYYEALCGREAEKENEEIELLLHGQE